MLPKTWKTTEEWRIGLDVHLALSRRRRMMCPNNAQSRQQQQLLGPLAEGEWTACCKGRHSRTIELQGWRASFSLCRMTRSGADTTKITQIRLIAGGIIITVYLKNASYSNPGQLIITNKGNHIQTDQTFPASHGLSMLGTPWFSPILAGWLGK